MMGNWNISMKKQGKNNPEKETNQEFNRSIQKTEGKNIEQKTQMYFRQNVKALTVKRDNLQRSCLFSSSSKSNEKMRLFQWNYLEEKKTKSLFFPVYSVVLFSVFSISKWIMLFCVQLFELGIWHPATKFLTFFIFLRCCLCVWGGGWCLSSMEIFAHSVSYWRVKEKTGPPFSGSHSHLNNLNSLLAWFECLFLLPFGNTFKIWSFNENLWYCLF